jgi:BTB/POZ domain
MTSTGDSSAKMDHHDLWVSPTHSLSSSPPKLTLRSRFGGEMVTIVVGPDKHEFLVPKSIICKEQYFKAAFTGNFKESGTNTLIMLEEDPVTFDQLLRWIHGDEKFISRELGAEVRFNFRILANLYILADKLNIIVLRDNIIKSLNDIRFSSTINTHLEPNCEDVKYVYQNTIPNSKLRQFLAAEAAIQIIDGALDAGIYEIAFEEEPQFGVDLVKAVDREHIERADAKMARKIDGWGVSNS